jgi:hypothetical protein
LASASAFALTSAATLSAAFSTFASSCLPHAASSVTKTVVTATAASFFHCFILSAPV